MRINKEKSSKIGKETWVGYGFIKWGMFFLFSLGMNN